MTKMIAMIGLAAALTLPLATAPGKAHASCEGRKATGTVVGGVGGALIGNSLARGGAGAVLGGLGGAVLGHEIAGAGCGRGERRADHGSYRRTRYAAEYPDRPVRPAVYYDQNGAPIAQGPGPDQPAMAMGTYAAPGACSTQIQSYYDSRGALVQRPVQNCAR